MRKQNIFYILFFLGFIFLVFRNWFFVPQIIGGDWPFVFQERIIETSLIPPSWNPTANNGLGGTSPTYFLQSFAHFTFFISMAFKVSWVAVYKIFWFGLFLLLSFISTFYLFRTIVSDSKFWQRIIGALLYTTNTYILMLVGGGQMGVALAYSLAPLVLAFFIKIINLIFSYNAKRTMLIQSSLLSGVVISAQILFDPRIAYLTVLAIGLYLVLQLINMKAKVLQLFTYVFLIPGIITVGLHAAWIIPLMITRINPINILGDAYAGAGIVKFLSFASFSQSFSLLHPNWPENIFGKTYFMKAEFILLPIIAYSSLLFFRLIVRKDAEQNAERRRILFFALLGIVGAFLAKGANPPFGGIYLWLFENIPGFVMFRDPTKFYLLVALSYSILIPFSIYSVCGWVNSKLQLKSQSYLPIILLTFFIVYWVILIHPAIFGQLGGTFKKYEVPKEYIELKDFLYKQPEFFRTLWVPRRQRFSFVSDIHPAIEAEPLFGTRNAEELSKKISSEQGQFLLSEFSVKYILIPYDSLGEQFLDDRKYSEKHRIEYEEKLDTIPWLKKIRSGKIAIYKTSLKKDHFFLDKMGEVSAIMINPMHYVLTVSIDQPQNLIFSENFSPHWILTKSQKIISSRKTKNGLNSFWLERKGRYTVDISFNLEKYYEYGRIISFLTIIALAICLIKLRKKRFDS